MKYSQFLLKHEKAIGYFLILLGGLLLLGGLCVDFFVLEFTGYKHLNYWLSVYLRPGSFIKPLSIITGCFLLSILLFKKQLIEIADTCKTMPKACLVILSILIFIALGLVAYIPFHNYPYSMDEYDYLYQAKIFSQGKLFIEVPEIFRPFKEAYMILNDGKLFSKYPPGFSLILSIGVLLHAEGLVNPLIATITIIILYSFVKSFLGPKYGLISVLLISTTPYFIAYSASYFSEPAALLWTTLILFLVRKYELTSKDLYLPLIGLVSVYSFLTRPLDSFCVLVPAYLYLFYILHNKRNLRKITYAFSIFAVGFALFLIHNYGLIGKPGITTYPVIGYEFRIVDPGAQGFFGNLINVTKGYMKMGLIYLPRLLLKYLLIPSALFIPLFSIFGAFKFNSKWKWVLVLHLLMLILLYNFHPGYGWPQYGARHYYSGFVSLAILATTAVQYLIETVKSKKLIFYLLALVLCTHAIFSFLAIISYSDRFKIQLAIREDIVNSCPENSIVILNLPKNIKIDYVNLGDAERNPFMEGPQLIMKNDKSLDLDQIQSNFPDRSICHYNFSILYEVLKAINRISYARSNNVTGSQ
jgi:4-amino-4-deoxy-L-arabinose transferase-like glycosyltransferase